MKHLLLSLIAFCFTLACGAATKFVYEGVTYSYNPGTLYCEVSSVPKDYEGVFVIPREVELKGKVLAVTSIGRASFKDCTALTGVEIHDGITSIAASAFYNCSALVHVDIPGTVKSCGKMAFYGCKSLTGVTLGEGVETLEESVFEECSSLERIAIPEGCTKVGAYAFCNCVALKEATLPSTLTGLSTAVFCMCTSLTEITVPASVMSIADYAFAACGSLRAIHIDPNNKDYTDRDGVVFTKDMQAIVLLPAGYPHETYTLPEGVVDVNPAAFQGNDILKHLVINEGVKNLRKLAIIANSALESVSLPASLENYEAEAIYNCYVLSEIHLAPGNEHYRLLDGVLFTKDMKHLILSPAKLSRGDRYDIPDGVEHVCGSAFSWSEFKEVNMPSSVTSVGDLAFDSCYWLTTVSMSPNLTAIPFACFAGCESLTQIDLPDAMVEIGVEAFYGCPLRGIVLPAGVVKIGRLAFTGEQFENVYCLTPVPPQISADTFCECAPTVHVIKGLADVYRDTQGWNEYVIVDNQEAPEGITEITADAAPAATYDLLGRRVARGTLSPCINHGRKIIF